MRKTLTVFTPTYNRAYTLGRVYESLVSQSSQDFHWLIVDDGSSDGTRELVEEWRREGRISLDYVFQPNGGMLRAHNTALRMIQTELFVCLDSDDYFKGDAVEKIIDAWAVARANKRCGGVVGLDVDERGNTIGDCFPDQAKFLSFLDIRFGYRLRGDKKYVMSKKSLEFAGFYPEVEGEHFPAASYLYRVMARRFVFRTLNEPLCVVEYLADGNSSNKINQYRKHPNAFMLFRLLCMDEPYNLSEKFWSAAHYVSSAIFARKPHRIILNRHWVFTVAASPVGIGIWLYSKVFPFASRFGLRGVG